LRGDGASRPAVGARLGAHGRQGARREGRRGARVRAPGRRRAGVSAKAETSPATEAAEPPAAAFRRVLVKLSREALMGDRPYGIEPDRVRAVAGQLERLTELGVQTAVVVGAGNIYRGMTAAAEGMDRATAAY